LSFNQPKFCPTATRNSNGITFANQSMVGHCPRAIFVSTNNTIYVANKENNTIVIWQEESINPIKIIDGNFTESNSLFVTTNGDIYIGDDNTDCNSDGDSDSDSDGDGDGDGDCDCDRDCNFGEKSRVQKWSTKTNTFVTVMNISSQCQGLFVDINDTLYCSMFWDHQVVKRSLTDPLMNSNRVAAGTGIKGSAPHQLYGPKGIFVDVNLDLYVADCFNARVQLFQSGELDGITVVGSTSRNPTIRLSFPTGIILDADKYLFIVDGGNDRIVGSDVNGFRCLVGCYGWGSQSNQLFYPFSFSFDHSGNIFVTDQSNHRIQKFQYFKESCENEDENGTSDEFPTELLNS
ncbi:unnamed protein product, partial [Adineta steineri]